MNNNLSKEIELCGDSRRAQYWKHFANKFETIYLANNKFNWYSMDSEDLFDKNVKEIAKTTTYSSSEISYQFNEYGFRSVPFLKESHKDFNILFGGCSITAGVGLPIDHVWTSQITEMIQKNLPDMSVQQFNIALGGRSIDSVARYLYLVITKDLVKPDLVLLNLPPLWRKEIAVDDGKRDLDLIHYIPPGAGFDISNGKPHKMSLSLKRYTAFANDTQLAYDGIKNLVFIKTVLDLHKIPFMFTFWDNHSINILDTEELDLDSYLMRELPEDIKESYAGDLSMCTDSFIEEYRITYRPKRLQWENKFPQKIARDLAHYGPNSHFDFANNLYHRLKTSNLFTRAIEAANERKKLNML